MKGIKNGGKKILDRKLIGDTFHHHREWLSNSGELTRDKEEQLIKWEKEVLAKGTFDVISDDKERRTLQQTYNSLKAGTI